MSIKIFRSVPFVNVFDLIAIVSIDCGGYVYGPSGEIYSPGDFQNNECHWKIECGFDHGQNIIGFTTLTSAYGNKIDEVSFNFVYQQAIPCFPLSTK